MDPSAAETTAAVGHVSETVDPEDAAVVAVVPPPEVGFAAVVVEDDDELEEQPASASADKTERARAQRVDRMRHALIHTGAGQHLDHE